MLDYDLIKKMNSKNISIKTELTKERLKEIWGSITRNEMKKIVQIGGFSNSRTFNKSRKTGIISVRMTLAIAIGLEINPFYLSGEENDKNKYSEEQIISFIKSKNIHLKAELDEDGMIKKEIKKTFLNTIDNLENIELQYLESLKKEEILTLMEGLFIKEKILNTKNKILLIKLILTTE